MKESNQAGTGTRLGRCGGLAVVLIALVIFRLGNTAAQEDERAAPQGYERETSRYIVSDLGTLGGTSSLAVGVNNRGWVTGWSTVTGNQEIHATLWAQEKKVDVGTLGGPNSEAWFRPSERGWVVGRAETSAPDPFGQDPCQFGTYLTCLPFIWKNGVMTALPTLGGSFGTAFEVNNSGQVAGVAAIATADPTCAPPFVLGYLPVLWKNGQIQQHLPTVSGDPDGYADAINDEGQAVGGTGDCIPTAYGQPSHAVLWENGDAIDLGSLGGAMNNLAMDINNHSQVVGYSDLPGDVTTHAFRWQNGVMIDLGTITGDFSSQAEGIDSNGRVVGASCDVNGNCRAFLWEDGVMTDLNALTPADSPLYTLEAFEINAEGQIAGYGLQLGTGEVHAFLATPIAGTAASGAATAGVAGRTQERPKVTLSQNVRELLRHGRGPLHPIPAP
jgi:probable HAF family extracellular repeat protein